MCWLKGVLLELAVLGSTLAAVAAFLSIFLGISKLTDASRRFMPDDGMVNKVGKRLIAILFGSMACVALISATIAAKNNVCKRGFVEGYKAVISDLRK
jgi:hypothetical protein